MRKTSIALMVTGTVGFYVGTALLLAALMGAVHHICHDAKERESAGAATVTATPLTAGGKTGSANGGVGRAASPGGSEAKAAVHSAAMVKAGHPIPTWVKLCAAMGLSGIIVCICCFRLAQALNHDVY